MPRPLTLWGKIDRFLSKTIKTLKKIKSIKDLLFYICAGYFPLNYLITKIMSFINPTTVAQSTVQPQQLYVTNYVPVLVNSNVVYTPQTQVPTPDFYFWFYYQFQTIYDFVLVVLAMIMLFVIAIKIINLFGKK